MFGHQDHDDNKNDDQNPALPPADDQQPSDNTIVAAPISHPLASDEDDDNSVNNNHSKPEPVANHDENEDSTGGFMMDDEPSQDDGSQAATPNEPDNASASTSTDANGLLDIKQNALQQLSPLVGHLDQSPEEKFRTTMMLIQASDNQSLIKEAFAAAKDIKDDKERAQALLDVINEINYFTQQKS